ncbi:MAG: response regulator transcription factor [Gemmatimonadaceae bacterium]|nr:response regulator transcription factor [Gemmatimonadaceae bacterium]
MDQHAIVRAGLRALLKLAPDVDVVAGVADCRAGLVSALHGQAQVLLMDRPAGGEAVAEVVRRMADAGLRTHLLVLTSLSAHAALESLLIGGARGYLTRTAAASDLLDAVRTVARGATYRCPTSAPSRGADVDGETSAELELRRYQRLTEREREVLVCTAHGFTAPEIGLRLNISPKTVDTYKQRIHEKLGLHHRTEYVRLALKLRLMDTG